MSTEAKTDAFVSPSSPPATAEEKVRRDRWGRYLIPNPVTGQEQAWTRATTFAKSISDTFTLTKWKTRMAVKGLALRPDLFALAAATPLDDRDALNRIANEAQEAAAARASANLGTALHSFTEQVDRGENPVIPQPWDRDIAAYRAALEAHRVQVNPAYVEGIVVVPELEVAGTFDRLVTFHGRLTVGDLKTGRDLTYGWNEIAIQLAIYSRATHIFDPTTGELSPMPTVDQDQALVFHLPVGQGACTIYSVDIRQGWQAALLCAQVRAWRANRTLARVLSVADATGDNGARVTPAGWVERLQTASSVGELSAVWREADARGEWTPELEATGLARKAVIEAG